MPYRGLPRPAKLQPCGYGIYRCQIDDDIDELRTMCLLRTIACSLGTFPLVSVLFLNFPWFRVEYFPRLPGILFIAMFGISMMLAPFSLSLAIEFAFDARRKRRKLGEVTKRLDAYDEWDDRALAFNERLKAYDRLDAKARRELHHLHETLLQERASF